MENDLKYLLDVASTLCSQIQDEPAGCEACWLRNRDDDDFDCDVCKILEEMKKRYE